MKRIIILGLITGFIFSSINIFAQSQTNMYYRGELNSWGSTQMTYRILGISNWMVTIQATADDPESEFKYANTTDWSDKDWSRGAAISLNSLTTFYQPNQGNGYFIATNGKYYTFTIKDVASGNSNGYVMETSAQPVTIDAVSQSPLASVVSDNDDVTVTITTSASPCAEEHIFVRYSTDNWTSSSVVEATFTGTSGTATIPAQSAETSLSYYVFSTTVSNPTSDYDLLTIHYNDNSGTHYNYTVKYGTTADGDWNNTSTWKAGAVPGSTKDVVINHAVTVSNSISSPAECNNLIINNGTLTINVNSALTVNGTFTNNGTFTANQGTVNFPGGNTVSGTVTFYDVNISGGVDFGLNSTISGTLTINTGGYVNNNPPVYGTGSTLKYNTGGTYGRNKEWMSTSGAGYPYNVQISNNTTVNVGANSGTGTERDIANNLTIDAGSELALNIDNMTQPVVVNGDVTVNGTLSLSNSPGGDLKLKGNLVFGSSSTLNSNSRAIFFIGETTQTVQATNASTYDIDYLVIGTPGGGATTLQLDAVDIVTQGPNGGNAITFENATDKIDLNGRKLTIGMTGVSSTISGSGSFVGSATSEMVIHGTGDISLNFDQTTPGTTNTLKNLTIDRTGGTVTFGNDVEIASGGVWTINPNSYLTISGSLTNNAGASGLVISSDANGTGSLKVTGTVSGSATVHRYISLTNSDAQHGWHFISSPVSNQAISTEFVDIGATPISSDVDFYRWSETENLWINIKDNNGNYNQGAASTNFSNNASPVFEVDSGYLIAYSSAQTKTFSGAINNSSSLISGLSKDNGGWHLLGNPFPCALYWNKTTADWNLSNISTTAKIWNESNASYSEISSGTGIIPAMQGFMVEAIAAGASLTIPLSDRTHTTAWYKDAQTNVIKLTVYDTEGNTAQESIVRIAEGSTAGFDTQYDAHFLAGYAPQFYSVVGDEKLSTNTIPDVSTVPTIPFEFIKNNSNTYYIEVEGVNNLVPAQDVYLTDLKTNYTQKLNDNPVYHFTAQEGDAAQRFELHFNTLGVKELNTLKPFNIYGYNNRIIVQADKTSDAVIYVYNTTGQLITKTQMTRQTLTTVPLNGFTGVAVVSVVSSKGTQNQKVIIR